MSRIGKYRKLSSISIYLNIYVCIHIHTHIYIRLYYIQLYMAYFSFIHLPVGRYLCGFHIFSLANTAVMNIAGHVCLQDIDLIFLDICQKVGDYESYDSSYLFSKEHPNCFSCDCTNLHSSCNF